jgi:hypothetical protein
MISLKKIDLQGTTHDTYSKNLIGLNKEITLFFGFIFFFLLNSNNTEAQNSQWQYINDFTRDWKIYDGGTNAFLPFIPEIHSNKKCIYLKISKENAYINTFMVLKNLQGKNVFVNQSLVKRKITENEHFIKLAGEEIIITILSEKNIEAPIEAKIALQSVLPSSNSLLNSNIGILQRWEASEFLQQRFLLIGISSVILMICLSMLTELRFALASTFNLLGARIFFKDNDAQEKLSGQDYIAFIICYSLTLTYFYLLLGEYATGNQWFGVDSTQLLSLQWKEFFIAFVFFSILVVGKFALIWILANLHNARNLASDHHFEFIQTSFTLSIIFMVIGTWFAMTGGYTSPENFSKILVIVLLFKSLLICWKVQQQQSLKKIYLFSYFCGTEILPILISAKFLIKV